MTAFGIAFFFRKYFSSFLKVKNVIFETFFSTKGSLSILSQNSLAQNSVSPDQVASSESGFTLFSKEF